MKHQTHSVKPNYRRILIITIAVAFGFAGGVIVSRLTTASASQDVVSQKLPHICNCPMIPEGQPASKYCDC